MRPNFKVVFMKKVICGFREQCTRPTKKKHRWKTQNALPKTPLNIYLDTAYY